MLYTGAHGRVAHECILDLRKLKELRRNRRGRGEAPDGLRLPCADALLPVADTLMVEPTESESKEELERFCDAMISIHGELEKIRSGQDRADNPLKNAPHTALELAGDWKHAYSREEAAYPKPWLRASKYWPPVKRIDNVAGDRNFVCTCPPIEAYA